MATIHGRITNVLLALVLMALLAVIGMLAAGVRGGPLDPPGPPGETDSVKLPGTPVDGPTTISESGHYYLTRDVAVTGDVVAVTISASDVSLDLGGFTISGSGSGFGVSVGGVDRVSIRNGTVRNFAFGIFASSASHVRIHDVAAVSNSQVGIEIGGYGEISDCTASLNENGIVVGGSLTTIRACDITGNVLDGIRNTPAAASGLLVEGSTIKSNNTAAFNGSAGIWLEAGRATLRANELDFNSIRDMAIIGPNSVMIDNIFSCPTWYFLDPGALNTFIPINSTDPHTNRSYKAVC